MMADQRLANPEKFAHIGQEVVVDALAEAGLLQRYPKISRAT
jgi:hypothetical protein